MSNEELMSAVATLADDAATPLEQQVAREAIIDFICTITDPDTQEVLDQLCVECMDERKSHVLQHNFRIIFVS